MTPIKRRSYFVLGLLLMCTHISHAQIRERPARVWNHHPPQITHSGGCSGNGTNAYLEHPGGSPTKIGVCTWMRSETTNGVEYSNSMRYYSVGSNRVKILLGCQVGGTLEFRLAYFDADDGYDPAQRLFHSSDSALVLLRRGPYAFVRNNHMTKAITVNYTLGRDTTIATVEPQSDTDLIVNFVSRSNYLHPYQEPIRAHCD